MFPALQQARVFFLKLNGEPIEVLLCFLEVLLNLFPMAQIISAHAIDLFERERRKTFTLNCLNRQTLFELMNDRLETDRGSDHIVAAVSRFNVVWFFVEV